MKRILFCLIVASLFCSTGTSAQSTDASPAVKVWDIYRYGVNCYGQDFGAALHKSGWDRYLLYYGAVTDQFGGLTASPDMGIYPACGDKLGNYSENIWLTWSTTDGREFGQEAGVKPPLLILTSLDFAYWYNSHLPPDTPIRYLVPGTQWLIGDPAVEAGKSGTWYMFFDTQSAGCGNAPGAPYPPQNGIYVATSDSWYSGWEIRGKPKLLVAGTSEASFPSVFREPDTGEIILYYGDGSVNIRAARLIDDGVGLTLEPVNDGKPVIVNGYAPADRISVFKHGGKYYAVADRFGEGKPESLNQFYLLGPSENPYGFDWAKRKTVLERRDGTFYDQNIWAPSVVSPADGDSENIRVYFWAAGTPGCWMGGHESAGLLEIPASELP